LLLLVYRSVVTVVAGARDGVSSSWRASRGMVAFLGYHDIIGLSTFAVNLLTTLAISGRH